MSNEKPIGIFDSGFGGLTVARAVMDLLPSEDVVYFGDTARYPYGPKPLDEVREFAFQIAEYLINEHDVKLLVVACNTAAAAALDELSTEVPVPIIGVIAPGAQAAIDVSEVGQIAVIGTVGTINSGAYERAFSDLSKGEIQPLTLACPGFVEFVEKGESSGEQLQVLAERLLAPIVSSNVDTLLLGCTHYPYLARAIGQVVGSNVVLVSSADETAFEVSRQLNEIDLLAKKEKEGKRVFISSGDVSWFAEVGQRLFGPELASAQAHEWNPST
ncbi:MAG: glutamate racemase [Acidimicrobiaceae bacterium]|nr:glutamate racemase [Acidimicrobiaceae bacterium]